MKKKFILEGSDEKSLNAAIEHMDHITEFRSFYPDELTIVSVINVCKNINGRSIIGIRLEPDKTSVDFVLKQITKNSGRNDIASLTPTIQKKYGITEYDLDRICKSGFYFEYAPDDGSIPEIIIPDERFLDTFCKNLHVGKLDSDGFTPLSASLFRDLYIANLKQG